jgi:site-specific DNA-methyltransferase (adenine-specific)
MFSFSGDTVIDPFCGSGSTAVAACRAGRNSVSSDIEIAYVNATVNRLKGELAKAIRCGAHIRQLVFERA